MAKAQRVVVLGDVKAEGEIHYFGRNKERMRYAELVLMAFASVLVWLKPDLKLLS